MLNKTKIVEIDKQTKPSFTNITKYGGIQITASVYNDGMGDYFNAYYLAYNIREVMRVFFPELPYQFNIFIEFITTFGQTQLRIGSIELPKILQQSVRQNLRSKF